MRFVAGEQREINHGIAILVKYCFPNLVGAAPCADDQEIEIVPTTVQHDKAESFGFERSLYGGDWHVLELAGTYPDWVDIVDWAMSGVSAEDQRKLYCDNAIRFYRLDR